jgi:hypothetical protein
MPIKPKKSVTRNKPYTIIPDKIYSGFDAFICVPMNSEKIPTIAWKGLTKTPISKFNDGNNIALITGMKNRITVVDIDISM